MKPLPNVTGEDAGVGVRPGFMSGERGSVSVSAAIVAVAFLFVAVALISQQTYLSALSEVREVAKNAARSAGQKLDPDSYFGGGRVLEKDKAEEAALAILADVDGVQLRSLDISDEGQVTVVVSKTVSTVLGTRTFTGEARSAGLEE